MTRNLEVLEKYLVVFLLFILPTQIALHFWPYWAFVFGIRVDLLAPTIYLTDVFVASLFLIKVFKDGEFFKPLKKYKTFLGLVSAFTVINYLFSTSQPESIYKWLKFAEFSFVVFYFARQQIVTLSQIVKTLFYSLIAVSLIGIFQFTKGGTIGGFFYYAGERSFNQGTPGIALVSLNGAEHLRAYSTFSHPNSLAGFLGAVVLFILLSGKLKKNLLNFLGILIILTCFLLTFSISAYLGIFLTFALYLFSKNKKYFNRAVKISFFMFIVSSLLLPLLSQYILKGFPVVGQNISQRLDLAYLAGKMISQRFWIGEGLGTFIVNIPLFKDMFTYSWLLQPVHNLFLLLFSELGIFGLLGFCFLLNKSLIRQLKNRRLFLLLPLIFILFTGLFDHYSFMLQQNTLLFSILIGLSFHEFAL